VGYIIYIILLVLTCITSFVFAFRKKAKQNKEQLKKILGLFRQKRFPECNEEIDRHLKEFPYSKNGLLMKGNTCLELMKLNEAEKAYEETIKLDPKNYKAIAGLGVIMRYKKDFRKAEDYYYKALKINPDFSAAKSSLMLLELYKGNIEVAIALGEDSIKNGIEKIEPAILGNLVIAYHSAEKNKLCNKYFNLLRDMEYADLFYIAPYLENRITIQEIFDLDLSSSK